jgi:hypothetical protein
MGKKTEESRINYRQEQDDCLFINYRPALGSTHLLSNEYWRFLAPGVKLEGFELTFNLHLVQR